MRIIPAINCPDFKCVKEKLQKAAEFLPPQSWGQLDIADGKFTTHQTWNNPAELKSIKSQVSGIKLEVHLMVEEPEKVIDDWVKVGAERIIVHVEALTNSKLITYYLKLVELGLAINPETPVESPLLYLESIKFVQLLAVSPGKSGQKFDERIPEKIKFLKKNHSDVIIEVDGGINLKTAKLCKDSGADILVAGSYIWESDNPAEAYKQLASL